MKWYVLVIFLVTGLSLGGLLTVFFKLDPYRATNLTKYLFFSSSFLSFWGLVTLSLNRFKFKMDWPDFYKSFKIGLIVSILTSAVYILTTILVRPV